MPPTEASAVIEGMVTESRITPYFGTQWLEWLLLRAGPTTRSRVLALIETIDMSNEVFATYLLSRRRLRRPKVDTTPISGVELPPSGDRATAKRVLDEILVPNMRRAYDALDLDFADPDWVEAFRVLRHAGALVIITEDVIRDMDVRVGRELLRSI